MGRGLRPDVGGKPNGTGQATLVDAVVGFMQGRTAWEGTTGESHVTLAHKADDYQVTLQG